MAALLDATSGYHTYPHIDMDAAAKRTLALLIAKVGGPRPAGDRGRQGARHHAQLQHAHRRRADGGAAGAGRHVAAPARHAGCDDLWRLRLWRLAVRRAERGGGGGEGPEAGAALRQRASPPSSCKRKQQFHVTPAARRRRPAPGDARPRAKARPSCSTRRTIRCPAASATPPACSRRCWTASRRRGTVFAFFWDPPLVDACHQRGATALPSRPSSADGSRPISAPPCRSRPRS